jgi:small basic protein
MLVSIFHIPVLTHKVETISILVTFSTLFNVTANKWQDLVQNKVFLSFFFFFLLLLLLREIIPWLYANGNDKIEKAKDKL